MELLAAIESDLLAGLEAELFADRIRCESRRHLAGEAGHDPDEGADWLDVPPCGCRGMMLCGGRVAWLYTHPHYLIVCQCGGAAPVSEYRFAKVPRRS